jgi:hypothetical protein
MDNSIKLFAGSSHPELAQLVARRLGITLANVVLRKFSNQVRPTPGHTHTHTHTHTQARAHMRAPIPYTRGSSICKRTAIYT